MSNYSKVARAVEARARDYSSTLYTASTYGLTRETAQAESSGVVTLTVHSENNLFAIWHTSDLQ